MSSRAAVLGALTACTALGACRGVQATRATASSAAKDARSDAEPPFILAASPPAASLSSTEARTVAPEPPPASPSAAFPFGPPSSIAKYSCPVILAGGPFHAFLAAADTRVAFVDGDDLLALVNRSPTGALPPTYAPRDLVDLRDLSPQRASACENRLCLRREAAIALRRMFDAMRGAGIAGRVDSAFRGFGTQCWVFGGWAAKTEGGFCEATTQSALPGHSQHQLGTTVDAFTSDWAEQGARNGEGVFRNGFGCTRGGRWFDENAYLYGFVVSYPIDPEDRKSGSRCQPRPDRAVPVDPKTGYKHEPWHLRYIGVEAAARYHEAWLESGPGTASEITLEQWLRTKRGLEGDAELPVCDGCQCGACATMATAEEAKEANESSAGAPCGDTSLLLGRDGLVVEPAEEPRILDASAKAVAGAIAVDVTVDVPAHTPTQTPASGSNSITDADAIDPIERKRTLSYLDERETYLSLVAFPGGLTHSYPDLPHAWRLAVEAGAPPSSSVRWPWRASLAEPGLGATWNRTNVLLPAKPGRSVVRLLVPASSPPPLHVTLLRSGIEHQTRTIPFPPLAQ